MPLLWSADGRIGCDKPGHAPHKGSDTWRMERWRKMPEEARAEWEVATGSAPECETCVISARNAAKGAAGGST